MGKLQSSSAYFWQSHIAVLWLPFVACSQKWYTIYKDHITLAGEHAGPMDACFPCGGVLNKGLWAAGMGACMHANKGRLRMEASVPACGSQRIKNQRALSFFRC